MSGVSDMDVSTKRSVASGNGIEERRGVRMVERTRTTRFPRPDRTHWQEVGHVQRVQERPSEVLLFMSWQTLKKSVERVYILNARPEPKPVDCFFNAGSVSLDL